VPDHPLPSLADPVIAAKAFAEHKAAALEGLRWRQITPLSIAIELPASGPNGPGDIFVALFRLSWYPTWPPSVTFVDPDTLESKPSMWPRVDGKPDIAFYATYGDAPDGMVCNSMFFEYYFWGGHGPTDAIRWDPKRHTLAASLNELKDALRSPYYTGRQA